MKKLLLISALSVSSFILANTKEVSEDEQTNETEIFNKKKFAVYCKYNNYVGEAHESATITEMLAIANDICSTDKPSVVPLNP